MKPLTHKQKAMRVLADGKPHTSDELYDLRIIAHSRIADLRRDGHTIDCWRDGDNYVYLLKKHAA